MDSQDSYAAQPPQLHRHPQQLHLPAQSITMAPPQQQQQQPKSKKHRGRPLGSVKKQHLVAQGTTGAGITPHVIMVKAGEDISSKVLAFSQEISSTVCVLSANGFICSVSIRQPGSGCTVMYEGKFEILRLSGSFSLSDNAGTRIRCGALSVSLVGGNGIMLGGVVAGDLIAATIVQIVVGCFILDEKKPRSPSNVSATAISTAADSTAPPSQGGSNNASEDNGDDESGGSPTNEGGAHPNNYIKQVDWENMEIIRF